MYIWVCVTSSDTSTIDIVRYNIYANTMEHRCGQYSVTNCQCDVPTINLRRLMCRLLKIDVSTFGDQCVDLRRSMIDVSLTFEDR